MSKNKLPAVTRMSERAMIDYRRINFNQNFIISLKWNLNEHEQDRLNHISNLNLMEYDTVIQIINNH